MKHIEQEHDAYNIEPLGKPIPLKKNCYDEKPYDYWLEKYHYYYYRKKTSYRHIIPEGTRLLVVGCKNGYLLDALNPCYGVGIDADAHLIHQAKERYSRYTFITGTITDLGLHDPFDYIIIGDELVQTHCVQTLFESLKPLCHVRTRLIIDTYNPVWRPCVWLGKKLGILPSTDTEHWLSSNDIANFLHLTEYEIVTEYPAMLLPVYLPLLSTLMNVYLRHIPILNRLYTYKTIIARPLFVDRNNKEYTVSIIVPCRNEKGNIEAAITRTACLGRFTEIIFVEGNSHDGTLDEIYRLIQKYPHRALSVYQQKGKGKADAVRLGFDQALGDILMILDADLTMPPEELHKFYHALITNKGDLINGSRLVYGMEDEAMRFLNLLANIFFARLFSWLLDQSIGDTLCGTKVLWREDYRTIARNRSFFGNFDPFGDFDLLFGAAKQNLKIVDMPVHYKNRTYGQTQIRRFYCGWILLGMSLLGLKKFKLY